MEDDDKKIAESNGFAEHATEKGVDHGFDSDHEESILGKFTYKEQRKIIHKIDRRLVPMAGLMYCISLLDRSNLGNASIAGMTDALRLDIGARYSIITLVFFITYVICQPPATILIRKFGPRNFIPLICFLWGGVMIGFGFTPNWQALIGLRMLLGILEAGFFPGVVYLLSTWYSRYDVAKRYSVFYIIGVFSSGFGGILAFGLMQMEGLQNLGGWRWIFIIEGVLTCIVGFLGYLFLLSFPDDIKARSLRFLKPDELRYILARVDRDRGDARLEPFQWKKFLGAAFEWRIWLYALIFGSITTVTYALAYFLPIILNDALGFSVGTAQCLVAPPYAFAGLLMFFTAWASDHYKQRGLCLCFNSCLALIGLPIMGFVSNPSVRYFGVFLATAGANGNVPISLTYQANNIRGQWKRAFCSATLVGMGGVGGIVGSTVYRSQDAPNYVPGLGVSMGANVVIILFVLILSFNFRKENRRADRGELVIANEPGFRYTF